MVLVEHVKYCLSKQDSKLTDDVLAIHGMSTPKIRHLLNNLVSMDRVRYLEVGLWKGATFISALYGNTPDYACGVDDWSVGTEKDFHKNIKEFIPGATFDLLAGDSFKVSSQGGINVYLYDASHTKQAQIDALEYYYDYLANEFIYLVDDYNLSHVRDGTQQAIKDLNLKIEYERWMGKALHNEKCTNEWWLGFYISVLRKWY